MNGMESIITLITATTLKQNAIEQYLPTPTEFWMTFL